MIRSVAEQPPATARIFMGLGAALAGLGVAAGAFGAHGLEGLVTPERVDVFNTGVQYHLYHALALLFVGWAMQRWPERRLLRAVGACFVAGIAIFSGSLYVLVLADLAPMGMVTPLGGVAFIAGWGLLAVALWRGDT